jgi:TusA-related sulfurtransferase
MPPQGESIEEMTSGSYLSAKITRISARENTPSSIKETASSANELINSEPWLFISHSHELSAWSESSSCKSS